MIDLALGQHPDRITGVPAGAILSANSDLFNKAFMKQKIILQKQKDKLPLLLLALKEDG
ncbi:TPA: hypothetical protein JGU28_004548 [Salmonella enterica]|nr:hypothetical protein [Salmonella enterica]